MNGAHIRRPTGFGVLRYVLAWSVIAAVGATIVASVLVPRLAGATPYVILTGSMQPSLPPGTMVVTRPVAAEDVAVGTVITYQLISGEPTVVTHRVVSQGLTAAGETVFRTQGDANTALDPGWVKPVQIRGERWYAIPYVGRVTTVLNEVDRTLLERLLAIGLLGYAAVMLVGAVRERRTAVLS